MICAAVTTSVQPLTIWIVKVRSANHQAVAPAVAVCVDVTSIVKDLLGALNIKRAQTHVLDLLEHRFRHPVLIERPNACCCFLRGRDVTIFRRAGDGVIVNRQRQRLTELHIAVTVPWLH